MADTIDTRVEVVPEGGSLRQTRYATLLQTGIALLAITITLMGGGFTYAVNNDTRMAIAEHNILELQTKTREYDRLIEMRREQWEKLAGDLGTIKESLKNLEQRNASRR